MECSFDGHLSKRYQAISREDTGQVRKEGIIRPGPTDDSYSTMNDVAIGMLIHRKDVPTLKEEFPHGMPGLSFHLREGLDLGWSKVLPDLENVAGEACHVVEQQRPGSDVYRFWIAHAKGMLVMRQQRTRAGAIQGSKEVLKIATAVSDAGEIWYPSEMRTVNSWMPGSVQTLDLSVHEFVPHVKVSPEIFDVHFPAGTAVLDQAAGTIYTAGTGDQANSTDRTGSSRGDDPNHAGTSNVNDTNLGTK
jgi:hypothetical protein